MPKSHALDTTHSSHLETVDRTESCPVSVVIPTFNGRQLLEQNLPAVLAAMRAQDELVIVDDASQDDTVEWLSNQFQLETNLKNHDQSGSFSLVSGSWSCSVNKEKRGRLRLIANQNNLRFAASCNRGVEQAQHQLVLLLNNDVSPTACTIEYLLPHFSDETTFAVGCLEIEPNLDNAVGGKNKLWFEKGLFHHSRADEFSSGETAWASGGSAMFDREKWLALSGFDLDFYPAYWEDIDLSYRARRKYHWQVWFDAKAKVYHNHQSTHQTVLGSSKIQQISWKNADKFTWKNGTFWQKFSFLLWRPYWWWQRSKLTTQDKQLIE